MLSQPPVTHQHHPSRTISDLGDVIPTQTTLHDRVRFVISHERLRRQRPRPRLRIRIVLRIAQIQLTDRPQMLIVDPVATVVLARHPIERIRPEKLDAFRLMPNPRRRRLHRRRRATRHRLLLLNPKHQHTVVAARLDLRHPRQHRHRRRCTRRLMPHRRHPPQLRLHRCGHGAQMALAGVELPERVADMDALDRVRSDPRIGQRRRHHLRRQVGNVAVGLGQVVGEVGLMNTKNVGHVCSLQRSRKSGLTTLPTGLRGRASINSSRSGSL